MPVEPICHTRQYAGWPAQCTCRSSAFDNHASDSAEPALLSAAMSTEDREYDQRMAPRRAAGAAFLTVAAIVGALLAPQLWGSILLGLGAVLGVLLTVRALRVMRR